MPVPDDNGPDVELPGIEKLDLDVAGPELVEMLYELDILEEGCVIAGELDVPGDERSDVPEDILLESPLGLPIPGHSDTVDHQS